jgi:hypothetical protein
MGKVPEAIGALEEVENDRVGAIAGNAVNQWVRASAHLARPAPSKPTS